MHSFELGDKAFLKPEYCPILVVGRYEDFYEIQHEVYPDEIVLKDGETLYGDTSVEVIGDMDFSVVIEYAVRADQLISKPDFDALCEEITRYKDVEVRNGSRRH